MNRIIGVYFSPTHTSEKIIHAVAQGAGEKSFNTVNLTFGAHKRNFGSDDLVLFAFPVYSGRIPETALARLQNLNGNGAKAAVIAVYGNRAYNDALLELRDRVIGLDFKVISAAAFIGEHSFSVSHYPIAEDRPDSRDLKKAREYGASIINMLDRISSGNRTPDIPGNVPYRERSAGKPISPRTDENLCTNCLACISACPVGAITSNSPLKTDSGACIKCCACIKVCGVGARAFDDPGIEAITKRLYKNFRERREPEIFFSELNV